MLELTPEQLRQLQMIELEMLIEVDRICKKHEIKYNIIGGTMLGAIRHGGFIPWDDDADIFMLRDEYTRFRRICQTDLDKNRFYFQDAFCTEGYRWGYGKIRRKGTLFLRENQEHMPYDQGVFIDIMPLDNTPASKLGRRVLDLHCFCLRKVFWSEVGRRADSRRAMRVWYSLLARIPREVVLKHLKHLIIRCKNYKSDRVRVLLMPNPNEEKGYLRKWFETSKTVIFEGIPLQGINDHDGFLTYEFGNYMELPPIEKRKVHPVSDIRLTEPELPEVVQNK